MIFSIDHIGVATEDPQGVGEFLTALRMTRNDQGIADEYGVSCEFWQTAPAVAQPAIELVSPVREPSAVTAGLARSGPGLHHVAFEVDDVLLERSRLRRRGFVAVDATPCAGARPAMQVAFLYAGKPAGLLIELVAYGRRTT